MSAVQVVGGIIENERGDVLLAERPPGKHLAGLWEFPGGKIEAGETPTEGLKRELKEELELDVAVGEKVGSFPYTYPWGQMELHVYRVRALSHPKATTDVHRFRWVAPSQIVAAELAPADVEPLEIYLRLISSPSARSTSRP
jgi:8-oxo-dGTP diphosphatase